MTGGQDAAGAVPVPDLTRLLEAEGVGRILVLTDEPEKYPRGARWAPGVEVWHRDRLDEAQRILREAPGVTALIYDQRCAAEKRRLRKRGKLPDPALRVVINELVCEGCGDCGVKSNCLSVQPVETEFGRKTQIHQSSCNKDYSCLRGDCPSFLTVVPSGGLRPRPRKRYAVDRELPEPELRVRRTASLFLMGIGGTGVVTVNQILGTAALLDGKHVAGLDQTGLSQKGGPVVSHLRIGETAADIAGKVGRRRGRSVPRLRPARRDLGAEPPAGTARPHDRRRVDHPGADGGDGGLDRCRVPGPRRPRRRGQPGDPQGRERVRRRARPGGGALRRPHGRQHDPAGRGLPGGRDPGASRGDRGGHRDQRRPGRDERPGVPRGPAPGRRSRHGSRRSSGRRAGAVAARERARARGAGAGRRRGRRRRAAAAPRGARPRSDRVPGRGLRAPLRRLRPDGRRGGAGGRAGRDAARRGGGALSPQADGLQGRVRGGAAPPPAGGPRVDPGGDGRGQGALPAPSADPPGARA